MKASSLKSVKGVRGGSYGIMSQGKFVINDCRPKTIGSEITSSPVTGNKEHVTRYAATVAAREKALTTTLLGCNSRWLAV